MSKELSKTPETTGDGQPTAPELTTTKEGSPKPAHKSAGNLGETIQQLSERPQGTSDDDDKEAAKEAREAYEKEIEQKRLWRWADVPELHKQRPDEYTAEQLAHIKRMMMSHGKGAVWAIVGEWGTGKTQIGVEVIRKCCLRLWPSLFTTAIEFFISLRSPYKDGPLNEQAVIDRFVKPQVLVIDDAHIRNNTNYEIQHFHHVIDKRHKALKTTILTSNQSVEAFTDTIGGAIIDRMCVAGGTIECSGGSFRGKEAKE